MSSRRLPYLTFGMCCLLLHLSDLSIDRTSVVWKAAHAASSRLSAKTHLRHFPRLECQAPQQTEANKAPKSVGPKPAKTCIQKKCLETYNLDLRAQRFLPVASSEFRVLFGNLQGFPYFQGKKPWDSCGFSHPRFLLRILKNIGLWCPLCWIHRLEDRILASKQFGAGSSIQCMV